MHAVTFARNVFASNQISSSREGRSKRDDVTNNLLFSSVFLFVLLFNGIRFIILSLESTKAKLRQIFVLSVKTEVA